MSKHVQMNREQAEIIALQALVFLTKDQELFGRFIANSGTTPQDLKDHFTNPDFLGGVLDTILADDAILLDFCSEASLSPETLLLARRELPGGINNH
ncbi:MAG: hypothetical protein A3J38_07585 [Gammaproteobacteria bacterium RIFCSPHIGHO2_12_FULL_45_9]|nr:MAG: hypothetical protein A3J38_07585 [Gammaproteobacteria bacterium RIFCSPHIGHO2_12_FULL_45_9]